jgi:hypothetical protein
LPCSIHANANSMRNLVVERDACAVLGGSDDDGRVTDFCIDATEGRLYAVTEEAVVLCLAVDKPDAVSRSPTAMAGCSSNRGCGGSAGTLAPQASRSALAAACP